MRAVNLLTYDAGLSVSSPKLRVSKGALPFGAALLGALACGFVALQFTSARADVASLNDQLDAVRAQQAALEAQTPKGDPQVLAERRQRESALATALDYRIAWENLLGDVGYVLPSEVLLTTLHAETPTSPVPTTTQTGGSFAASGSTTTETAPTGPTFTVSGLAPSQRVVAKTIRRLALVPGLKDVALTSSVTSTTNGKKALTFTVTASVRQKGATP
jgi:Tfp pilus assembly protein PilN